MALIRTLPMRALPAMILFACALLGTGAAVADEGTEPLFQFPQQTLSIHGPSGRAVNVRVWIADTPARQQQGLMYVRDLDEHGGMLFRFATVQRVSMWMKNTYIALDMLFLDSQGRIDYIAANTTPLSLDLIQPPRPVATVVELKGGAAARLGVHVGDVATLQQ